ncbi:MAG: hypothetical protein HFI37_05830, partial [Lachnospiraceae bacterium]|nr:hypothetical protein [Lachnospiraceae bacterium]
EYYSETLDELEKRNVNVGSKLLEEKNRPSLLAMVAYSYKEDLDLDEWFAWYVQENSTYMADQKKNYLYMKKDFEKFCITVNEKQGKYKEK